MEYIILAAGVGSRLYPYTKNSPKCLIKVTDNETIVERAVKLINEFDREAHITLVLGFQSRIIKELLGCKCDYIDNPFYRITNSIASIWFAKDLLRKNVPTVILNADIVFSKAFAKEICSIPSENTIYYDSSINTDGDYNVQQLDGNMLVMGKELEAYSGEYVGITKFTPEGCGILLDEVNKMIHDDLYDQWYENALVQLSLNGSHTFKVMDASEFEWSEIDSIANLLKIREIIKHEKDEC